MDEKDVKNQVNKEAIFRALAENASDGIAVVDSENRLIFANQACHERFGYDYGRHEMVGLSVIDLWPEGEAARWEENVLPRAMADDWQGEVRQRRKDGSLFDAQLTVFSITDGQEPGWTSSPGPSPAHWALLVRGTDGRETTPEDVADLEREIILDSVSEHVIYQDTEHRILWPNRAACESVNATREELIGVYCYNIWPQRDDRCPDCPVADAMAAGRPQQTEKQTPDGRYWFIRGYPVYDAQGELVGGIEVTQEITERKRAEERIAVFKTLADNATDAISMADMEGTITYANRACYEMFGLEHDEEALIGRSVRSIVPEEELADMEESFQQAMTTGSWSGETKMVRQDGTRFDTSLTIFPLFDEAGQPMAMATIMRDVTEQKQAEEALQHRVAFEDLVANISTRFVNVAPEQVDEEIDAALEAIGEFAGVDRSYLFLFSDDGATMSNTHEWCGEGIVPYIDELQNVPVETFPWLMERLRRIEAVHVPRVTDLPPEASNEKQEFESEGIQSIILVPTTHQEELVGFLGFDAVREEKAWTENDAVLLRLAGETFVNALERRRTAQVQRARVERIQRQQHAVTRLATHEAVLTGDWERALNVITETVAETLDVERVSIWLLDDDQRAIACEDLFQRTPETHSAGLVLKAEDYPAYFAAIMTERTIDAHRARTDPRTSEFAESYLKPLGITSMLDSAIRIAGQTVGVVCHEHVDKPRHWKPDEVSFVGAIADQVAQVLANAERRRLEQQIRESSRRRARQVELTTEIAQDIARAPALEELYGRVVTLVKERFGYYHVQIFRYDAELEAMRVVEGYGDVGDRIKTAGHSLPYGRGVVGTAAATGESVLASDVGEDPYWVPHPDLPETRGELAVPIKWQDEVLGVLDVQSDEAGALTEEDRVVLMGLAGQIASAIESTNLLADVQRSQQFLDTIIDNIPNPIFYQDAQGVYLGCNEAFLEYLGRSEGEVRGKTVYDITPDPELADLYHEMDLELIQNPGTETYEAPIEHADGSVRDVVFYKTTFNNPDGSVGGLIGTFLDITERKRTERMLNDRVKELNCLSDLGQRIAEEPTIPDLLQWIAGRIPSTMQYPDVCVTAIEFEDQMYGQPEAIGLPCQVVAALRTSGETAGHLYVAYEEKRDFLDEESAMLGGIVRRLESYIERRRAAQQLEKRAQQLAAVAEVAGSAGIILDPAELVQRTVDLVRDRFDLYYVGLFVVDEAGEWTDEPGRWAVLRTGTGEAGRQMLEEGHKLRIGGDSMIGWCIANEKARIALDVGEEAIHFENPHLPKTRSELALPIITRGEVIGALTIQSTQEAAFSEEDITVFQTMVDQVATAIENARLFEQTQEALDQTESLYENSERLIRAETVDDVMQILTESAILQQMDRASLTFFDQPLLPGEKPDTMTVAAAWERSGEEPRAPVGTRYKYDQIAGRLPLQREEPTIVRDIMTAEGVGEELRELLAKRLGMRSMISWPLVVGNRWIGALTGQSSETLLASEDDIRQISSMVDQAASVLQNQRLVEQTQEALAQTRALYAASRAIAAARSQEDIVDALVKHLDRTDLDRIVVALITDHVEGQPMVEVQGVWDRAGQEKAGRRFTLDTIPLLAEIGPQDVILIDDLSTTRDIDETSRATFQYLGVQSVAALPISVGQRVLGWLLLVTTTTKREFTTEEIQPFLALVGQAAVALESQQLLAETERRAQREQTLREITARVRGFTDPEAIVRTAVRELGTALGRPTFVRLGSAEELSRPPAGEDESTQSPGGDGRGATVQEGGE